MLPESQAIFVKTDSIAGAAYAAKQCREGSVESGDSCRDVVGDFANPEQGLIVDREGLLGIAVAQDVSQATPDLGHVVAHVVVSWLFARKVVERV